MALDGREHRPLPFDGTLVLELPPEASHDHGEMVAERLFDDAGSLLAWPPCDARAVGTGGGGGRRPMELLVAALVTVACLTPIVTSAVVVRRGWIPVSDTAIIATRARDVFTDQGPLLGQPSTAGATVGEQVHHPGPLEFWAIAVAQEARGAPDAPLVAIALVNAAAVLSILWWVRSLGGVAALALAAVPLVTMLWSLRGEALVDPLNPSAAVLPFAAYLVSLVAVGRRRRWALLSAVLTGSWAAQAHLTVTGLVVVAGIATAVASAASQLWGGRLVHERERDQSARPGPPRTGPRPGHLGPTRPTLVALVALGACWAGPIIDVAAHGGGNLAALVTASGAVPPRPGSGGAAVDRAVQALTWRPVWAEAGAALPRLLAPPSDKDRGLVAVLWVSGLGAAVANRRRAPALGWAFAVASAVLLAGTLLLSRLPGSFFNIFQSGNYLWLWPAGALLWSASVGGVLLLAYERLRTGGRIRRAALVMSLGTASAIAVATVSTPSHRNLQRDGAGYVRAMSGGVAASLDRGSTYFLHLSPDLTEQVVDVGLLLDLERRGFDLRVDEEQAPSFGPARATGSDGTAGTLLVELDDGPPAPPTDGASLLASYRPPPALRARSSAAERAVARRIDHQGGPEVLLSSAPGVVVPPTTLELVRGDLLGLVKIGAVPPAVAAWPETEELVAVRALATRYAAVHLLPADRR